ncbi:MAG: flagellar hook-basal body complex protein [Lachnospiraceae bacterium]|nr:flagellar hook-basal body complex protein [Lachnospiraceae bacterium]
MMRSLYSGVAGLRTHQTRMDVIGNNIANVNTTAYKTQSMSFADLLYQNVHSSTGATAVKGGTNARQIGLGTMTGSISTAITKQGAAQTTNNPFDLMINGDNFFIVNNGKQNFFTRDGSFNVDAAGNLVMNSNGYIVQGWQANADGTITKAAVSNLQIMKKEFLTSDASATTSGRVTGIVDRTDPNIASAAGKTVSVPLYSSKGETYSVVFSISAMEDYNSSDGRTSEEGYYAAHDWKLLDSDGNEIAKIDSSSLGGSEDYTVLSYSASTGEFQYVGNSGTKGVNVNFAGLSLPDGDTLGGGGQTVSIDFSESVMYGNDGISTVAGAKGNSNGENAGWAKGDMSGISISTAGIITAQYTNGETRVLGQIATAQFKNPAGLEKAGDNLYTTSLNSGEFDGTGVDITAGGGSIVSGYLEMSNVDMSDEFTSMITTQRGFQANSKVITTSDSMLEILRDLKR